MLTRKIASELKIMADAYPVVTVIGPRQSGKTTLVRALFPDKPYISLENPDERAFATTDAKGFLGRYPEGAILDEIQRQPELLSYIQTIVDEKKLKGMFILTGSHQLLLHESITQSLAGRTAILKLMPLSLSELPSSLTQNIDQLLYQGMYPRLYNDLTEATENEDSAPQTHQKLMQNLFRNLIPQRPHQKEQGNTDLQGPTINPTKYYRDYVQTYVERDVRQMLHVKDLKQFQHFLKLCAGRIGQVFNANSLSHDLGISRHTVENWLSILEASFILFRLQPYYENLGKRLIKSPKLYFTDVGVAAYLLGILNAEHLSRDPLRGNLFENFVIMECIKEAFNRGHEPDFYYYRDSNQNEVDLLFKRGHELIPLEIKSSKTFHPEFMNSLHYFKNLLKERCPTGYLIYGGDVAQAVTPFEVITLNNIQAIVSELYLQ